METRSAKFDSSELDALNEIEDEGLANTRSEALRLAVRSGLSKMGYLNGQKKDTHLRVLARRFADAFALLAVMWIGVSFWLPVDIRMFAAAPVGAAFACLAADRLLATREPAVSNRLKQLFGGDTA